MFIFYDKYINEINLLLGQNMTYCCEKGREPSGYYKPRCYLRALSLFGTTRECKIESFKCCIIKTLGKKGKTFCILTFRNEKKSLSEGNETN